ncbi:Hypothetical predicted protein [Mytilus galloprovincialis]|uniref:Integrase zinc-binding domain-containing protein n=1 Tax=Mytilus galloprovincialis TaxID=29158 RepID=A0A8B6BH98_MYTGA|nr:Hypothetical predicted protein [Mytilus galloprovincialis]
MLRQKDRMFLKNGILYRKVTDPQQGETHQFVVPEALQKQVLEMLHEQAGHQGIERTTSLIRSRCYWTGMFKDIDNYCKTCERCNVAKMPCPRISVPMSHLLASKPNEILAIDFTILEPASDGRENVLVITDKMKILVTIDMKYVSEHLNKMKIAYEKAGEHLRKEAVLREKAHNTKASEHKLGVGTRVLIRNRVQGRNKIQDKWNSLQYQVIKCLDSDRHVYLIEPIDKSGQPRVENRTNLQVCKFKPQTDSDSSSDEDPIAVGYNGYRQLRRSNRTNFGKPVIIMTDFTFPTYYMEEINEDNEILTVMPNWQGRRGPYEYYGEINIFDHFVKATRRNRFTDIMDILTRMNAQYDYPIITFQSSLRKKFCFL